MHGAHSVACAHAEIGTHAEACTRCDTSPSPTCSPNQASSQMRRRVFEHASVGAKRLVEQLGVRAFVVFVLVVLSMGSNESPAQAHSASNSPASNYRTKLLLVSPTSDAYQAKVIETGNRFELRWKSGPELLVPDYDDHPYLRIGPKGVEENQQSNAKYLNSSRLGSTDIPDGLKPEGPPQWKRISTRPIHAERRSGLRRNAAVATARAAQR